MKLHVLPNFDGDLFALGVEWGIVCGDMIRQLAAKTTTHRVQLPEYYRPFIAGICQTTGVQEADMGGVLQHAVRGAGPAHPSYGAGEILVVPGYLGAYYKIASDDELMLVYGNIGHHRYFSLSVLPHPPGTLFGMNDSGVAWASYIPKRYDVTNDYYCGELLSYTLEKHPVLLDLVDRTNTVIQSAIEFPYIKNQEEWKESITGKSFLQQHFFERVEDNDLYLIADPKRRLVYVSRGTISGCESIEIIYDIKQEV